MILCGKKYLPAKATRLATRPATCTLNTRRDGYKV
jgi:hypothetical protein